MGILVPELVPPVGRDRPPIASRAMVTKIWEICILITGAP
jgi:hypothetical protein